MIFGKRYFNKVFRKEDPWGYSMCEYERVKYLRQLEVMKEYASNLKNILEVGCAEGAHTAMMTRTFPDAEILCVDISPVALERARKNCQDTNVKFLEGNIVELIRKDGLPRDSFDVIVQSECLYCMAPGLLTKLALHSYIRDMVSTLRKGGIIVTANGVNITTRHILRICYFIFTRFCNLAYSSEYREWNEFRNKFITYELKVFMKKDPSFDG
ncbi:MAG: class I SAM-dependent methyltransferase [Chloroflexi bacterium]|nr:class I SAM-dependent methyltransferase [Chloroflexota bacterium]